MPFFKYVLGLDLGVTSIGWALLKVETGEDGKPVRDDDDLLNGVSIAASGVRIFPATTEDKTNAPKNHKRRASRGARRLVMRKAKRRTELRELLTTNGLLPGIGSAESETIFEKLGDPYALRVRALDEPLQNFELGRAIYHLSKRRGFLSNRKSAKSKEDGVVYDGINQVRAELENGNFRTLGELLATKDKKRKYFTHRTMSEDEFESIWLAQKEYHNGFLTDELKSEIKNTIFYQRPLKLQRGLIGKCTFETDKKRCDLARQEAQRFRYWHDLNSLQLQDPQTLNQRPLTLEEKERVAKEFENTKELTYKKLRKLLRITDDVRINLEANEKKLYGNKTAYAFRKAVGGRWDEFNEEEQNRLTEEMFRIENEIALKKRLKDFWNFDDAQVEKLEGVWHQLEDGYSRLSLKAIRKVLPLMIEGKRYDEVVTAIYGDHRKKFGGEEFQKLEMPPKDLRNPIVYKALCEVRKVVNAIIREYGRPDEVRLEMARDLKLTKLQKDNAMKQANQNKRDNEEAERFFMEKFGLENVSGTDKLKYRLWKESGGSCPYTGNPIPPEALLDDGLVDIEHIIPYSRCFDDSYMNKTICDAKFNREVKKNQAPGEFYDRESDAFAQLLTRISYLPYGKQRKFQMPKEDLDKTDWAGRQLSDTRYICREARGYLRQLYPYSADENKYVQVVVGGATANLRHVWHVNAILSDGDIDVKNRWDHRHHTIDAIVVALCERGLYQLISKLSGRNKALMKKVLSGFSEPWRGFLKDVETAMKELVVSHAPTRRVRGQLLEETAYGATNTPGVYVVKKSLAGITLPAVKNIVDPAVKELVELRLSQFNNDVKKAFVEPLFHKDGKTPIKNVRVTVSMTPETLVGIKDAGGKEYKYYPLAGNHHVDIFENNDGERRAELVPRFYAAQRNWKPKDLGPEWRRLFSLCANDYVEFRGDDGQLRVYRIQKMSGGGKVVIIGRPLEDARSEYVPGVVQQLQAHLKKIARKLQVDPLGRLSKASD
ncbi:MAG: type II CRISPR RNA-guided endonuclease Cas9 [Acidobacteria bacterium]|nr:type II CRISPR RNA-guided endonuclease Cas9 [Acidobacteriota bacterium]